MDRYGFTDRLVADTSRRRDGKAFRLRFEGLPRVTVMQSRFEELPPHDCFVTAANAFGIMSAGIDAAVVRFHGDDLMRRIQFRILDEYLR